MKVFDAITQAQVNRVPSKIGRVRAIADANPRGSIVEDAHWRVKSEVTVRFDMTGPECAVPEMKKRARRAIAHEIFGEIEDDLRELQKTLWEEDTFRPTNDPASTQLKEILRKVRGDDQ